MALGIAHRDAFSVDCTEATEWDGRNHVSEVFRWLSRYADFHEGERMIEPITPTARTAPSQIGETVDWSHVNLFDGRNTLLVSRLLMQLVEHRIGQDLASPFEALPFDVLRGIVELK
jgi:hypothetical protein